MNETLVIAIASAIIKKHLEKNPPLKGARGRDGKSFSFENYREDITQIISKFILSIEDDLKIKFSDLSSDEVDSLKIKFSDLNNKDKELLRGPRGQKGKDGKKGRHGKDGKDGLDGKDGRDGESFDFEKEKKNVENSVIEYVNSIKPELKGEKGRTGPRGLTGESGESFDFNKEKEEIKKVIVEFVNSIRSEIKGERGRSGPRGMAGKDGADFDFDLHEKNIKNVIFEHIDSIKDSFKLKFTDLSESEKQELKGMKGPRGQKGKDGRKGLSAYDIWLSEGNKGDEKDFLLTLVGSRGPSGIQGLPGLTGANGAAGLRGNDGEDGVDAPRIINVDVVKIGKEKFRFDFFFDNGQIISTKPFKIPVSKKLIHQTIQSIAVGGGLTLPIVEVLEYSGSKVTAVEIFRDIAETQRWSRTELTYNGSVVTIEDIYLYDLDGVTVLKHIQTTYTYSSSKLLKAVTVLL